MLIRRVLSGQGGAPGSSFGNRIHREDLARLITHCLQLDEQGKAVPPTLVAADEDTTPTYEVERWLAQKLGVNLSETPQQAISRANRQCRSALLKEIGFTLTYPSWREGYSAAINV
jgi:dTDP-4-dehydrorhamnose reductase